MRNHPQGSIFTIPWPNAVEFIMGVTAWTPELCVVVTNFAVYRVETHFNKPDVKVTKIGDR